MRTSILLAAVIASQTGFAQGSLPDTSEAEAAYDAYYKTPIGPDPAFPDDLTTLQSCEKAAGPQRAPEDTVEATTCARAVGEWLYDTKRSWLDDPAQLVKMDCAYELILADGTPTKTVEEILAPHFDQACGTPPATM